MIRAGNYICLKEYWNPGCTIFRTQCIDKIESNDFTTYTFHIPGNKLATFTCEKESVPYLIKYETETGIFNVETLKGENIATGFVEEV